ncbi:hypothetical protein OAI93_03390, partial [bacterium]|nr:hypothetical protein [bacterium]
MNFSKSVRMLLSLSLLCSFCLSANVLTDADFVKAQAMKDGKVSLTKNEAYQLEKASKTRLEMTREGKETVSAVPEVSVEKPGKLTGWNPGFRDCVNDDSTSDGYGDTCSSWYDDYEYEGSGGCSGSYDDDDFNAAEQCCVCGGGSDDGDGGGDPPSCEDQGLWDCGDGECIPTSYVCDGSVDTCNAGWGPDCSNGADESLATCGDAHDECVADPTCADTECGGWTGSYTCDQLVNNYGFDCSVCIAEEACAEQQGTDGCYFDFTAYGAADCDAAFDAFGLDCATLEATYGWNCAGCECPEAPADPCADAGGNPGWAADGWCDASNNNEACGYDSGDCCPSTCVDGTYSCDTYGGDCADCIDPAAEDSNGGGTCADEPDPTCADTDCGYFLNLGYSCYELLGYGYDCSLCEAEGTDCSFPGCADDEFACASGDECEPANWECDGWADCADGSDEADCGAPPTCEEQGLWDCGDGQCVYNSWVCDGWADCSNAADEADCGSVTCEDQGLWDCGDGECIPTSYVCDGSSEWGNAGWGPDCSNGADEDFDSCCASGDYADDLCNPPAYCEDETACNTGAEGDCSYPDAGYNCDGSVADGYHVDCSGSVVSDSYLSWVGDGYCDDGAYGVYYDCCAYNFDNGDCGHDIGCDGVALDCGGASEDCAGECGGSAEFDECGECAGDGYDAGDFNSDCGLDVLDVIVLVNAVVDGTDLTGGDLNGDEATNVIDVVVLVNLILGSGRTADANTAMINTSDNSVSITADGYIGGVQMTLSHDNGFEINLTDNALVAEHRTEGTSTILVVVAPPEGDVLFTTNKSFEIVDMIVA